ncbi:MAG: hydantoinase B/oxoprolinase family protein [Amaricoccus sp.]
MLNTGLTRPFTCIAPEGTVLNPVFPAAVGMRSLTCARLRSVIFGAFSQAVPERMPAAPAGNNCIVNVMTRDERSARTVIAAVNPVVGGGGGMPHRDGTNGSGADAAYLKNTPIEITETEVPVELRVLRPCRIPGPGAGAAGWRRRWRSGCSRRQPDHGAEPGPVVLPAVGDAGRARGGVAGHGGEPGDGGGARPPTRRRVLQPGIR